MVKRRIIEMSKAAFTVTYILIVYILLVNKVKSNGLIYILKPKFTNSTDFFKKCEYRRNIFFQKASYFLHSSFLSNDL